MTALFGTLAVPIIQGILTSKREARVRVEERRHAAYLDAMTFAQIVEETVDDLVEDPVYRSNRKLPEAPDRLLVRARLELVAPVGVTRAFDALTRAWDAFRFNLNEAGPIEVIGDEPTWQVSDDAEDVKRLRQALTTLKLELKTAR
ncbi:hypothetical protein ACAG24_026605 [Mycobacterium sp. pW049]|uniref:hypothetical protein n=1 Tax=[Mycobacterium] bulgaricum TaxID=3238985 RepID=UPI00351B6895